MAVTAALSPSIFASGDERSCRQIEDQTPIRLFVEAEIEVVERFLRVTKLRLFPPPLQQPLASASEFVRDQAGDEIDGCHRFDLSLVQTRLQHRGDTAESQLS